MVNDKKWMALVKKKVREAGVPEKHKAGRWIKCRHGEFPAMADGLTRCIYCGPPI